MRYQRESERREGILKPCQPTGETPGSSAKQKILAERFDRGIQMHSPEDAARHEQREDNYLTFTRYIYWMAIDPEFAEKDMSFRRRVDMTDGAKKHTLENLQTPQDSIEKEISQINPKITPATSPGSRIRQAREQRGISQRQLARMVGTDKKTIHNIESSMVCPNLWTLYRVAAVLLVRIDWLSCVERRPQTGAIEVLCG